MRLVVHRRRPAMQAGLAGLAGLALALTACGGSDSEPAAEPAASSPPSGPSTSAAATTAKTKAAARRAAAALPQPAPTDLANFSCTRRGGVWSASGDISNSAKVPMVYTVTVVTVVGADTAGEDSEQLLLRPGQSTSFELPAISSGPADTCMPGLVRAPR